MPDISHPEGTTPATQSGPEVRPLSSQQIELRTLRKKQIESTGWTPADQRRLIFLTELLGESGNNLTPKKATETPTDSATQAALKRSAVAGMRGQPPLTQEEQKLIREYYASHRNST